MSAEVLRRAAALMRERAAAATPGPWVNTLGDLNEVWQHEDVGTDLMVCDTSDTYTIYPEDGPGEGATEDAAHVASWHPAVALAVADWLDTAGADLWAHGPLCACDDGCIDCDDLLWAPHVRRALAVARAYLNEPAPTP